MSLDDGTRRPLSLVAVGFKSVESNIQRRTSLVQTRCNSDICIRAHRGRTYLTHPCSKSKTMLQVVSSLSSKSNAGEGWSGLGVGSGRGRWCTHCGDKCPLMRFATLIRKLYQGALRISEQRPKNSRAHIRFLSPTKNVALIKLSIKFSYV
ncbi:hypothetical protein L484_019969 [Morus notabilis]|uniref:Uncharacterized protein n=1 Tax=Morus notabilis TaxID=981085 RepID=W9R569_9ROSA|nr:hypothetical protein L484_019969 [Morus notabilis]